MNTGHLALPRIGRPAGAARTLPGLARACALPLALGVLFAAFALAEPRVASLDNLGNLAIQASYLTIFAAAQVFVLIVRGFDLSLGTLVSLASVSCVMVMSAVAGAAGEAAGTAAAVAWCAVLGGAWGALNGVGVALLRVNPFIATLATTNIALGLATTISGGFPVEGVTPAFRWLLDEARPLGIPAPVFGAAIAVAFGHWLLNHTVLGRSWYLIGGNARAAHVAGLPVRRATVAAYVTCSLFVTAGALLLTARTGSGEPNLGGNLSMEAIAAAVIGGASLRGGAGGMAAALLGAAVITVLSNGMNLLQIDGYLQQIALGTVIVIALLVDRMRSGDPR